jgi:hypothetical protein
MSHASAIMRMILTAHPEPETYFSPDRLRIRPRHNTLFALEPLFILASLCIKSGETAPGKEIMQWLERMVRFASGMSPGVVEMEVDFDERQAIKLGFFVRNLQRWRGAEIAHVGIDDAPWPGGWKNWSKMAWLMI